MDIVSGNLDDENKKHPEHRGWFMGHFAEEPLKTEELEVNWGVQKKGDKKDSVGMNLRAKTLIILIKGEMIHRFPDDKKEIKLIKPGDFIFWDSGVAHSWEAITDSISVVVRWPSISGDQVRKTK